MAVLVKEIEDKERKAAMDESQRLQTLTVVVPFPSVCSQCVDTGLMGLL